MDKNWRVQTKRCGDNTTRIATGDGEQGSMVIWMKAHAGPPQVEVAKLICEAVNAWLAREEKPGENEMDAVLRRIADHDRRGLDAKYLHEERRRLADKGILPTIAPFCYQCSGPVTCFGQLCSLCRHGGRRAIALSLIEPEEDKP